MVQRGREDEKNARPVSDPDVRTSSSHHRGLSGKQQPRESGEGGNQASVRARCRERAVQTDICSAGWGSRMPGGVGRLGE